MPKRLLPLFVAIFAVGSVIATVMLQTPPPSYPGVAVGKLGFYLTSQEASLLELTVNNQKVLYVRDLDLAAVSKGCPVIDCIPSIDGPAFEATNQANRWLKDDDLVLGVVLHKISKAYPLRILNWHEIVNDRFLTTDVVISYCPLCNTGMVFKRPTVEGASLQFGVSGRLYFSDLVMFDRSSGSFWSQVEGIAIAGPLAGMRLERLRADVMPLQQWQALHPDTVVLARPTFKTPLAGHPPAKQPPVSGVIRMRGQFLYNYGTNPYLDYKSNPSLSTPFSDQRLTAKANIVGISLGSTTKAYPMAWFTKKPSSFILNDVVGQTPIVVVWQRARVYVFKRKLNNQTVALRFLDGVLIDRDTNTRWRLDGSGLSGPLAAYALEPIPTLKAYWFAWLAFHPHTQLYVPSS